jgi:ankyrin repeat protein
VTILGYVTILFLVTIRQQNGDGALNAATSENHLENVRVLLDNGADPNAKNNVSET